MSKRPGFPASVIFLIALLLGGSGAYAVRTLQLRESNALTPADVTIVETTAAVESTLLSVDSTVADTTIADTTIPDTTSPPTTDPPAPRSKPQIDTAGALFQVVTTNDRRLYNATDDCDSLARTGSADSCDRVEIGGVEIAWVVDNDSSGIDILRRDPAVDGDDIWTVVLHASFPPARSPRLADVTGDGENELVVGWRATDGALAVDVVEVSEGTPGVTLHLSLVDGRISVGDGQIDAWNGVPQPGDDPTSPSSFDHWTYTRPGGRWVATSERDDDPPTGQI